MALKTLESKEVMASHRKEFEPFERISFLNRQGLIAAILDPHCDFPTDFTSAYLATLSDDKLRHLLSALYEYGHDE